MPANGSWPRAARRPGGPGAAWSRRRENPGSHAGDGSRGGIPPAGGLRKSGHGRCATTPVERLQNALTTLGLKAVEARLEGLLEQAAKKEPSYGDFLDEVFACEVDARRSRYLRARLQLAHLPFLKTFEQYDFAFQPSIDERQIRDLRTLRFVHQLPPWTDRSVPHAF